MTYNEVLEYLYSQLPMYQRVGKAAYKADLGKTIALDNYFGNPHKQFTTVHIAGTNGKGSVAHSLASILQEAGYKTGLYTSPHLTDFRERIKINGQPIDKQYVTDFVQQNKSFFEKIRPSFFEMTVAMAFEYFKDKGVDIAVIEVGMGGRLDSTNIITPVLSVITNISYDHTQFLGDTLEKIAKEKAGIIKPQVPVVIGDNKPQVRNVFLETAALKSAPIYLASLAYDIGNYFLTSDNKLSVNVFKGGALYLENLIFDLTGIYQLENLKVILQSYEILKNTFRLNEKSLRKGLENVRKNTGIKGRWQKLSNKPLIIADIGHNYEGISFVVKQIKSLNFNKLHFVYGSVNDKNISKILNLLPKDAVYYFAKSSVPRSADPQEIKKIAKEKGLKGESFDTVQAAVNQAINNANNNDLIFIGGSAFVVADALQMPIFSEN